jgi:hypothetical protein
MKNVYSTINYGALHHDIMERTDKVDFFGFIDVEKAQKIIDDEKIYPVVVEELPCWQIFAICRNSNITKKLFPKGSTQSIFIWHDRAEYDYYYEGMQTDS